MDEDYEDYQNVVNGAHRLVACPSDYDAMANTTGGLSNTVGDPGNCIEPRELLKLSDSRQTVAIYGVVSPLFVAITLVTNCFVCVILLKPTMRTCTNPTFLSFRRSRSVMLLVFLVTTLFADVRTQTVPGLLVSITEELCPITATVLLLLTHNSTFGRYI